MQKYHPLFHKLKSIIGYSIAVVVILIALGVSGVRFLLTTANLYQQEVEDLASSLLEQPVKIGSMDARLSGLEPTLIFHDVELISVKTKQPVFSLYRVDIGLSIKALIWEQQVIPSSITVSGVNLEVLRTVEGKFKVKGVDINGLSSTASGQEQDATFKNWLLQRSNISLEDFNLTWKDEQNAGLTWLFDNINLLIKNNESRHQITLNGNLPVALGEKIRMAIDLEGDIAEPDTWSSQFYVEGKALNLTPIQKYINHRDFIVKDGMVDLTLWGDWEKSRFKQISGKLDLNDFSYQYKNKKSVKLSIVSGKFDALHDADNTWRVGVDKFFYIVNEKTWPESRFSLAFKPSGNNIENLFISASHIKLEALTQLAIDNNLISNELKDKIIPYDIKGDVRKFQLAWYKNKIQTIRSDFNNLGSASFQGMPAMSGISGHIDFNENKGKIVLDSDEAMIEFPGLFRNNFQMSLLKADINFLNLNKGTLLNVNKLEASNPEISIVSQAKLWIPVENASPYMDFQAYVSRADLTRLPHFLPAGIMSENLVQWLDKGIVSGQARNGKFIFNGKLNEFPFTQNEGVFKAEFNVDDFELEYQRDWPRIKKASIDAVFTGAGMMLNLHSGQTLNNTLVNSTARIESFSLPELKLQLNANGTLYDTLQFLVNSPILPGARETIKTMRMQGNAATKFELSLPLSKKIADKKPMAYQGTSSLKNASLLIANEKIDITGVDTYINFNEKGLSAEPFQAQIMGEDTRLSLATLEDHKGLQVSAAGKMEPGKILQRFNILGFEHVSGSTDWQGAMIFPGKESKLTSPVLKVKSDLQGVKSTLPENFYKTAESKQEIKLQFNFVGKDKTLLELELGKAASAILEINQQGNKVYLERGALSFSVKKAILPRKNILYVDGAINKFTPVLWQKALNPGREKNKQNFLVYPVILNLDELKINLPDEKDQKDKSRDALPDEFPLISGIIKKLYFDDVFLGRFDFNTSRIKQGIHFDDAILTAQHMKVAGKGDWTYAGDKQFSVFDLTLSSDNFGEMLNSLGFAAIIENGTAQAIAKLNWQAPLSQFSMKKLNGNIQLKMENGSIIEVDAGAGRMLGLFSLSALPRKLFGDFKDTFKSGFSFDKAKGEISIRNGDAYTDGFEINSAVAEITITGRTGIAARDYENTITVVPDVGGTAAGVIALLGNIPAGVGLWLVNKLSGDKINEGSMRKYEISGSWDKPVIERIDQTSDKPAE